MKHSARIYQDDLDLLDSINRMSRQLHFRGDKQQLTGHEARRLQLTVEELEEQMEAIRQSQLTHNHRKF